MGVWLGLELFEEDDEEESRGFGEGNGRLYTLQFTLREFIALRWHGCFKESTALSTRFRGLCFTDQRAFQ